MELWIIVFTDGIVNPSVYRWNCESAGKARAWIRHSTWKNKTKHMSRILLNINFIIFTLQKQLQILNVKLLIWKKHMRHLTATQQMAREAHHISMAAYELFTLNVDKNITTTVSFSTSNEV